MTDLMVSVSLAGRHRGRVFITEVFDAIAPDTAASSESAEKASKKKQDKRKSVEDTEAQNEHSLHPLKEFHKGDSITVKVFLSSLVLSLLECPHVFLSSVSLMVVFAFNK